SATVLAYPHDRGTDNDFLAILRCRTVADRLAETDLRHGIEADRYAFARGNDGRGQFAQIADARVRAHGEALAAPVDNAGADAGVVLFQSLREICQGHAERGKALNV